MADRSLSPRQIDSLTTTLALPRGTSARPAIGRRRRDSRHRRDTGGPAAQLLRPGAGRRRLLVYSTRRETAVGARFASRVTGTTAEVGGDGDRAGKVIRPYEPHDEAAVVEVWHRSGRAAYPYLPTWQAFTLEEARTVFRDRIRGECDLWVATCDASVVAYLALRGSYIDRLYVDPGHQRHGWGGRLVEHAKELHPSGLELHTHRQNHPARAFYERHGFLAVRYGISPPPESAPDVEYHWRPGDRPSGVRVGRRRRR